MLDKIALVCVTRNRPQAVAELHACWQATTTGRSDLVIAIDDDQRSMYERFIPKDVIFDVRARERMIPRLHHTAVDLAKQYKYVGFIGDDHRMRTPGWEDTVIKAIERNGCWGIAYGDDKLQGEKLATAAIISSNIINALGWICPPGFLHLCMDSVWMELGRGAKVLLWVPEVTIEHMHWSNGKSEKDAGYHSLNDTISPDARRFDDWLRQEKDLDIARLKAAMAQP